MVEIEEAKGLIDRNVFRNKSVLLHLAGAYGFVTDEDVFSDRDYPPFNRAAVDGFAIQHKELLSQNYLYTKIAEIHAGELRNISPSPNSCVQIMTGAAVPSSYNVLFKIEDCKVNGNQITVPAGDCNIYYNIDTQGKIVRKMDKISSAGEHCDVQLITVLASAGKSTIKVIKKPFVSIISTGNEIVPLESIPGPVQIRDTNFHTLNYFLQKKNITVDNYQICRDELDELKSAIDKSSGSEIIIFTGGVSAGVADFVPQALEHAGVEKIFHKVKMKPGKPLYYGRNQKSHYFGLPGNPFSVMVGYKLFVERAIDKLMGSDTRKDLVLPLSGERFLKGDRSEYFPVKIFNNIETGTLKVQPLHHKGSGDYTAAYKSDGIGFHDLSKPNLKDGDLISCILWE